MLERLDFQELHFEAMGRWAVGFLFNRKNDLETKELIVQDNEKHDREDNNRG